MQGPQTIIIHPSDNVAVALRDLKRGETLHLSDQRALTLRADVPYSHKVALADIARGADVIKYGENIGQAKQPIQKGEWIHTHNLDITEGA